MILYDHRVSGLLHLPVRQTRDPTPSPLSSTTIFDWGLKFSKGFPRIRGRFRSRGRKVDGRIL